MVSSSRRAFLTALGGGMFAAGLGTLPRAAGGLAARSGVWPGDEALDFGALEPLEDWTKAGIEAALVPLLEQLGIGMGKLAQPIRCSIVGKPVSPGVYETLEALGKEQSLPRLKRGLAICAAKVQG